MQKPGNLGLQVAKRYASIPSDGLAHQLTWERFDK